MSVKELAKQTLTHIFVRQMQRIVKKHQPKVVAVVGSVGKTSTKLAIATVLSESLRVQFQNGNYNTPISIPFIFLGRSLPTLHNPFSWFAAWRVGQKIVKGEFPYDVVVVELGTDKPGDILDFKDVLHPDIAVITAVAEEHMEYFDTIDTVAKDELSIAEFSDVVVLNIDDIAQQYITAHISSDAVIHSYGFDSNEYHISATQKSSGFTMKVNIANDKIVEAEVVIAAKQGIKAAAAAVAVADLLGLNTTQISQGLAKIVSPAGRMQVLKGIKNSTILDDSYNASPIAVSTALTTLFEKEATQRIAILGMMNELGQSSRVAHESIGKLCDPSKLDLVITLGKDANDFIASAAEANSCKVIRTESPYQAGKITAENIQDGAVILVKGSQNRVFSEEAIKSFLADPADANKLVRQSEFWFVKKRQQFKDASV